MSLCWKLFPCSSCKCKYRAGHCTLTSPRDWHFCIFSLTFAIAKAGSQLWFPWSRGVGMTSPCSWALNRPLKYQPLLYWNRPSMKKWSNSNDNSRMVIGQGLQAQTWTHTKGFRVNLSLPAMHVAKQMCLLGILGMIGSQRDRKNPFGWISQLGWEECYFQQFHDL